MFGLRKKPPIARSEIARAMYGFYQQVVQQNSHESLLTRAPIPVRQEIEGCDPEVFNLEIMAFVMAAMLVGSDELPDAEMQKVDPQFSELVMAAITDLAARERLAELIRGRLLLYDRMRSPDMFETVIDLAAYRIRPPSLTTPGAPVALRTWLRNLASRVIADQKAMIHAAVKRQILGD